MKKLSFALIGIGLLLSTFFVWSDSLGLGEDSGIGATQLLGIQAGIAVVLIGIGLMTVKRGKEVSAGEQINVKQMLNFPLPFWIVLTFLITYVSFFLLPVFFSKIQIQYLTKYIPNAFVTHIGFDIEAIVSRIENWLRTGQSPYADGFIAYPPLALALFAPLSILGYPAYFKLVVSVTSFAYLIAALLIPWLLVPKRNQTLLLLFFITGLFSYGLQFEQERGQFNLITFAFCLVAIYIFHFHPKFRFFAYLLFSLSVQLKVYPVFFVLMFVDDWRNWRNILKRFLGLGLLNFSLLFVLGSKLFSDFINAITNYQLLESSRYENLSIRGFVYHLANNLFGITNTSSSVFTGIAETVFWLILGLCFLCVIGYAVSRRDRGLNPHLLVICTIAALIIPSVSNDYKLSVLIAPMTLLLCSLPEIVDPKKKAYSILLIILSSLAYWTTLYPATVKPEFLGRNFPALMVILISVTILQFLAPYTYERNDQESNRIPEFEQ
jgi:hypothetical protein